MPPYDSTAISKADHSLHAGFMVLLRGLEVPCKLKYSTASHLYKTL